MMRSMHTCTYTHVIRFDNYVDSVDEVSGGCRFLRRYDIVYVGTREKCKFLVTICFELSAAGWSRRVRNENRKEEKGG